jgi:hypothetical protein
MLGEGDFLSILENQAPCLFERMGKGEWVHKTLVNELKGGNEPHLHDILG